MTNPTHSALPFRLGTTSYIIEADLVTNAAFLADKVRDMQLVLFDLPNGPSNLPSPADVDALNRIAQTSGLRYTVHLIDDLRLSDQGTLEHPSLQKAEAVIALTRPLAPWAYVLHLDGRQVQAPTASANARHTWRQHAVRALQQVTTMVSNPLLLAVENLEGYPPDFVTPVVTQLPVSRCVDIGHLWRDGHDPLPWLDQALAQTRVVHLHGVTRNKGEQPRDHQSLAHLAPGELDRVINRLISANYTGVLTLEVFGEIDFAESRAALLASVERCNAAFMC